MPYGAYQPISYSIDPKRLALANIASRHSQIVGTHKADNIALFVGLTALAPKFNCQRTTAVFYRVGSGLRAHMGHNQSRHLFPHRDRSSSFHSSKSYSGKSLLRAGSFRNAKSVQLDRLPLLVLECVCKHLCWHCLSSYAPARRLTNAEEEARRSGVETLYRLCLVSKAARDVAQPILFHRFRGIRAAHIAKFVLILQLRPDLALAVRTLQLELVSSNEHLVVELINMLPGLRSMELLHAPRDWTFAALRPSCLPSLEMLCVRFFGLAHCTSLLKAAPDLRELVVWSANPAIIPGTVFNMESVTRLKLMNCFPTHRITGYRDFRSLVVLFNNLESFELVEAVGGAGRVSGPTACEVITMLEPLRKSLRHLKLVGYGYDLEHHPQGGEIEPVVSLAGFPNLIHAEIPTVIVYGSGARRQPLKRVSEARGPPFLPSSIQRLTLGWFWELDVDVLPVDLLELVERIREGRFKDLKKVKLQSQTRKHIVLRIPGYDELARAFREVGVELISDDG